MVLKANLVGEFGGKGTNLGIRIPLTSDFNLNLEFAHNVLSLKKNKDFYYSVCVKEGFV